MKAELLPLGGKYYTTEVEITNDDGETCIIELSLSKWDRDGYSEPSIREEWLRKHPEEICDDHYESQKTYELAEAVVWAINNEIPKGW